MPFIPPAAQDLPTSGSSRGGQETIVKNWLNYWQSQLIAFFTYLSTNGIEESEIQNKAVTSRKIFLQSRKVKSATATVTIPFQNWYACHTFTINLAANNMTVKFESVIPISSSVANRVFAVMERFSVAPTVSQGIVSGGPSGTQIDGGTSGHAYNLNPDNRPQAYNFKFVDNDTKTAGNYIYRLIIVAVDNPMQFVHANEWGCSTDYEVYNGIYN